MKERFPTVPRILSNKIHRKTISRRKSFFEKLSCQGNDDLKTEEAQQSNTLTLKKRKY